MKIFRQIVLEFFFRTENKDGIELNHSQNASKFFSFSREAWHW